MYFEAHTSGNQALSTNSPKVAKKSSSPRKRFVLRPGRPPIKSQLMSPTRPRAISPRKADNNPRVTKPSAEVFVTLDDDMVSSVVPPPIDNQEFEPTPESISVESSTAVNTLLKAEELEKRQEMEKRTPTPTIVSTMENIDSSSMVGSEDSQKSSSEKK